MPRRNGVFVTAKSFDGFYCSFRVWDAVNPRDRLLRSYCIDVKVIFESHKADNECLRDGSDLMREFRKNMEDHMQGTVIVAQDDPELPIFQAMDTKGIIKLVPFISANPMIFSSNWFNWMKIWLANSGNIENVDIRAVEITVNKETNHLYSE